MVFYLDYGVRNAIHVNSSECYCVGFVQLHLPRSPERSVPCVRCASRRIFESLNVVFANGLFIYVQLVRHRRYLRQISRFRWICVRFVRLSRRRPEATSLLANLNQRLQLKYRCVCMAKVWKGQCDVNVNAVEIEA